MGVVGVSGVTGVTGSCCSDDTVGSVANSTALLEGSVISGWSSGNTLVGLGASFSQGKIGAGFWYVGVLGTS